MKSKFFKSILVILVLLMGTFLLFKETAFAAECGGISTAIIGCDENESGVGHILGLVIDILTVGVGILGVIGIAVTGIQYLTAGGNEEKIRKAKRRLFEIILGLVLYAVVFALLAWLLPGSLNPQEIPKYEGTEIDSGGNENQTPTTHYQKQQALLNYSQTGGTTFDYWLNVPEGATNGMPLVIFLHGDGEVGRPSTVGNLAQVNAMKGRTDFISIAPVTKTYSWVSGTIPGSLKGLIDKTAQDYQINTQKIYIIGFSRGAIGAWNMVDKYPRVFAAAVPISECPSGGNSAVNFRYTKIRAISGTGDENERYYQNCMTAFVNEINKNGGSATKETYSGKTHSSISAAIDYNELFNWLLRQ